MVTPRQYVRICWAILLCAAVIVGIGLFMHQSEVARRNGAYPGNVDSSPVQDDSQAEHSSRVTKRRVTFNRDVAPIVFAKCSPCHRAGEAVPFHLTSYAEFKKRAKQIGEVVTRRYMPPWMPEHGGVEFEGDRSLSDDQIAVIRNWVEQGAAEGDEHERPNPPVFQQEWRLGEPDVVAKMAEPFPAPAEGEDIYRNFVVPVGIAEGKWVRGVEIRPGGKSVVHHGFMFVDPSGVTAKQKDAEEPEVGYSGMDPGSGIERPAGQLLSWQPGKQASMGREGMAWWLPRHSDLVLQLHIRPSGKEEDVQAEVGLYFTDKPPAIEPWALMLRTVEIDIPPRDKSYTVETAYVLPVDVEVLSVLPHAHYLGKRIRAWATLPGGGLQWLLVINDWNFDWQGDYRYAKPLKLPRGTKVSMQYEYDNSEENPRNPNRPPKRVTYGLNSSDEMAEFHLQLVARTAQDLQRLQAEYMRTYGVPDTIAAARALLKQEPESPERMVRLGVALLVVNDVEQAMKLFNDALAIQPDDAKARYHLGHAYAMQNDTKRAVAEWKQAVAIDPAHFRAQNNLGYWYYTQKDFPKAEEHLRAAVQANENDMMSRVNLARVYSAKRDWTRAEQELHEALAIEPRNEAVRNLWRDARARSREK